MAPNALARQVPNFITCLALSAGLFSVYTSTVTRNAEQAAWLILYSVMLDKLDGVAARVLKASSAIGAQLDSFADYTAFGVAPAFLLVPLSDESTLDSRIVVLCISFYACSAAVRLATFNAVDEKANVEKEKEALITSITDPVVQQRVRNSSGLGLTSDHRLSLFTGVPSTMSGGFLSLFLIVSRKHTILDSPVAFGMALVAMGLLMNSSIPFPKLGSKLSKPVLVFALVNVIGTWVCLILNVYPEYPLLAVLVCFLIGPPIASYQRSRLQKK